MKGLNYFFKIHMITLAIYLPTIQLSHAASSDNTTNIQDNEDAGVIVGGACTQVSGQCISTGNSVTVTNSNTGKIVGSTSSVFGHDAHTSTSEGKITVTNSTINGDVTAANATGSLYNTNQGSITEFYQNSTATGNINIDSSKVKGNIIGALSTTQTTSADAAVTSKSEAKVAIISSDISGSIIAAKSDDIIFGDFFSKKNMYSASTIGDIIVINSKINGDIIAAYNKVDIFSSYGKIDMQGNITFEKDNQISGDIIGAYTDNLTSIREFRANGNITIKDSFSVSNNSEIWGAKANMNTLSSYTKYDFFSENTLTMLSTPFSVSKMGNFEYYNFSITSDNENVINDTNSSLITVTNELSNSNTVNNAGTEVNFSKVKLESISSNLDIKNGDTINLIKLDGANVIQGTKNVTLNDFFDLGSINTIDVKKINVGLVKTVDVNYSATDTSVIATIKSDVVVDPNRIDKNIKPLAESRLATLQNITRTVDSANHIMEHSESIGSFTPVAILDGGRTRYNTGSHIDSNDYHLLLGSHYQKTDNLSFGMLAEYGNSNFDTHNSNQIHGSGDTYNYGAKLLGYYYIPIDTKQNLYFNTVLGAGSSKTKFHSNDIKINDENILKYNSNSNYFTGSFGAGHVYKLNDDYSLDSSIHYLYSYLSSDKIKIGNEKIYFDTAKSSRVQLKEKLNYKLTKQITATFSGGYEYEFDGKAGASIYGINVNGEPSLKGNTWISELGLKTQPIEKNENLGLDISLKGYTGEREGINGSIMLRYDF